MSSTNKFSHLSDSEINVAIANIIFKDNTIYNVRSHDNYVFLYIETTYIQTLNFLDKAHIFDLMIENKITLEYTSYNKLWLAHSELSKLFDNNFFTVVNRNAGRAIAECFLLMNDNGVENVKL